MGAEKTCTLTFGRKKIEGTVLLETDRLIVRADGSRLQIPFTSMSRVLVTGGILRITAPEGVVALTLGPIASKWADKIRNPPTRIDKLGVRKGQRVLLVDVRDASLQADLHARGAVVSRRLAAGVGVIFVAANDRASLRRLEALSKFLTRDGAIWVIRPKGSPAISEGDVMKAGKAAGLVDVKVVRISDTHTAQKYVIPVAKR